MLNSWNATVPLTTGIYSLVGVVCIMRDSEIPVGKRSSGYQFAIREMPELRRSSLEETSLAGLTWGFAYAM
jgi:hypothetical protein